MGAKKPTTGSEESLGDRIRRYRQLRGLTQAELARQVGISRRMMAYYEIQGGEPRPELLTRFSETLDISLDALTGRKPAPHGPASQQKVDFHLWRRLRRLQELPPHDRKAILKMIDAMADRVRKTG
ncbi:MAG: helix-turn-helix transcriptional regulator [Deltaproteobacteria bacterium]|nr:helix-turn-helix transcriptional regulator [Deltaproteobacteria bacterium]